jgi:hypothetical protein
VTHLPADRLRRELDYWFGFFSRYGNGASAGQWIPTGRVARVDSRIVAGAVPAPFEGREGSNASVQHAILQ